MTTFLDDIFRPLTRDLLGQLGKSVTYTRVSTATRNASTRTVVPVTSSTSVPAVIEDFDGATLAAGLVQAGDKKVSIAGAALDEAPKPNDRVGVDGISFTVVGASAIYSGEEVALYELTCRRA